MAPSKVNSGKRSLRRIIADSDLPPAKKRAAAKGAETMIEYEVEKIVAVRSIKGKKEYLVKWKNWDDVWNEWVKDENLSCDELVEEFQARRALKRGEQQRLNASSDAEDEKSRRSDAPNGFDKNKRTKSSQSSQMTNNLEPSPPSSAPVGLTDDAFESDLKNLLRKYDGKWYVKRTKYVTSSYPQSNSKDAYIIRKRENHTTNNEGGALLKNWQRKGLDKLLKQWEKDVKVKCDAYGMKPIKIVNEIDLTPPPADFEFIVDSTWGQEVTIDTETIVGCSCEPFCSSKTVCCPSGMDAQFAYRHKDKLRPDFQGKPIFECNRFCSCDEDCPNRTVQRRRQYELCIFRTKGRGWGLKTLEPIKKDSFVLEYVGEVITNDEAERRYSSESDQEPEYLFDLDYHDWTPDFVIDATYKGNESHFVNHSCEPNLTVYSAYIDHLDIRLPRIALFAARDILADEELTFDYGVPLSDEASNASNEREAINNTRKEAPLNIKKRKITRGMTNKRNNGGSDESSDDTASNEAGGRTKCLCGSKNCRGFVFLFK